MRSAEGILVTLGANSYDEVPAYEAATHLAGDQEADTPEHSPFRGAGQPAEQDSQPLSEGLVECHRGLRDRRAPSARPGEGGYGCSDQHAKHHGERHPEREHRDRECSQGRPEYQPPWIGLSHASPQTIFIPCGGFASATSR